MSSLPQYEKLKLTPKQIKNFISTQITAFHRAMEKKDSTGFGDLDDATAEEQLVKICKFWYSRMPMYMTDFRHDLLPVIGDRLRLVEMKNTSNPFSLILSRISLFSRFDFHETTSFQRLIKGYHQWQSDS